jgi:hypothetical protein
MKLRPKINRVLPPCPTGKNTKSFPHFNQIFNISLVQTTLTTLLAAPILSWQAKAETGTGPITISSLNDISSTEKNNFNNTHLPLDYLSLPFPRFEGRLAGRWKNRLVPHYLFSTRNIKKIRSPITPPLPRRFKRATPPPLGEPPQLKAQND